MEYFSEAHFRAITNRMSLYEQRTYSDNYQGLPMNVTHGEAVGLCC